MKYYTSQFNLVKLLLLIIFIINSHRCLANVDPVIVNDTSVPFLVYVNNVNCMSMHDSGGADGDHIVQPGEKYTAISGSKKQSSGCLKGSTNYKFEIILYVNVAPYINSHIYYIKKTKGKTKSWQEDSKGSTDDSGYLELKTSGSSDMTVTIKYDDSAS
ncbi:hypothetical protein Psal006b_00517 [Piscirickettsia salmonis]|uniref:Membrane protein n=1 Tax=Piscirickettsia salmonis TaxID=1238 RepID=A0A1L6TED4_PISSA|nr:hypothetical protein [Piscirickettsia salmonis]AKP72667.1 hypothetical protein PSLF89_525 [Piscirickettsia salmonis LF-89 = ATCC VR-1361]ALB23841.1 membrane protein [Piscirickettsia salmonis]ALY03681.1 hypothetical protein AWE47_13125 [Piscirickettsia salmonis]AMA43244.1 hypothetical protein AWJ11_13350 [Piscirickettsia salmonis]AOS35714.1 hypothetical protein AVM72_10470 [Piscirickettsia salmonis]